MSGRRTASLVAIVVLGAGCSANRMSDHAQSLTNGDPAAAMAPIGPASTAPPTSDPTTRAPTTRAPTTPTTTAPTTTSPTSTTTAPTSPTASPTSSTSTSPSTSPSTTSTTVGPTTSTSIPLPPDVHDPACARVVQPGDSLSLIADTINDPTVTAASLRAENAVGNIDTIHPGDLLDVCPGNEIDDITGEPRTAVAAIGSSGVAAQQAKLNELFAGLGLPSLAVDGVSGPFTRQQLCAARMALHLPVSRADMVPGSQEEQVLLSATGIAIPPNSPVHASRWIVISKTCQVLFAGEGGNRVTFVFKTSTGEPGWETSNQDSVRAFRYDPALDNGGWHNSSRFPVAEDNPLNGNMYRPLYFHRGQAIHGAANVPPEPASKGCARLRPENQDALLAWLGLDGISGPTYDSDRLNVSVAVHGEFVPG